MRAFPTARFNERSALYGAAELRLIPHRTPLADTKLMRALELDWWQLVGFAEVGRVAATYSLGELVADPKWDVGVGLRAMMRKFVVRVDLAFAPETTGVKILVNHPF